MMQKPAEVTANKKEIHWIKQKVQMNNKNGDEMNYKLYVRKWSFK